MWGPLRLCRTWQRYSMGQVFRNTEADLAARKGRRRDLETRALRSPPRLRCIPMLPRRREASTGLRRTRSKHGGDARKLPSTDRSTKRSPYRGSNSKLPRDVFHFARVKCYEIATRLLLFAP